MISKMVSSCVVSGCKKESYPGCGISFHRIPADNKRRELWISAMKLKNNIAKSAHVCGLHFTDDDYATQAKSKLKPQAVPSILPKVVQSMTVGDFIRHRTSGAFVERGRVESFNEFEDVESSNICEDVESTSECDVESTIECEDVEFSNKCEDVESSNECEDVESTNECEDVESTNECEDVESTNECEDVESTNECDDVESTNECEDVESTNECEDVESSSECEDVMSHDALEVEYKDISTQTTDINEIPRNIKLQQDIKILQRNNKILKQKLKRRDSKIKNLKCILNLLKKKCNNYQEMEVLNNIHTYVMPNIKSGKECKIVMIR